MQIAYIVALRNLTSRPYIWITIVPIPLAIHPKHTLFAAEISSTMFVMLRGNMLTTPDKTEMELTVVNGEM
jgi:hypothetical protein